MGITKINQELLQSILWAGYSISEASILLGVTKQGIYLFIESNDLNITLDLISSKSLKTRRTILKNKHPTLPM